ncbi:hypothetical protein MP638_000960, partial [Amoeboaphelidium occidentale]
MFHDFKIGESEIMITAINRLKDLHRKLKDIGQVKNDIDLINVLLNGLGPQYVIYRTMWENDPNITFQKLTFSLLNAEIALQNIEGASKVGQSLMAKKLSKNSGKIMNRTTQSNLKPYDKNQSCKRCGFKGHMQKDCKTKICDHCHKKGHLKATCYDLHGKPTSMAVDRNQTAQIVELSEINKIDLNYALVSSTKTVTSDWILDSGSSSHITNDSSFLSTLVKEWKNQEGPAIKVADGSIIYASLMGNIKCSLRSGSEEVTTCLNNVLYVPASKYNLISIKELTSLNTVSVSFTGDGAIISHTNGKSIRIKSDQGIYRMKLSCTTERQHSPLILLNEVLWHQRFGHVGIHKLQRMFMDGMIKDFPALNFTMLKQHKCEACVQGKQTKRHFGSNTHHATRKCERIISDVWGPSRITSMGGKHYFVSFIDEVTNYCTLHFIRSKDEVFHQFKEFNSFIKGGEYMTNEFQLYLRSEGIVAEPVTANTPEQLGKAERWNRTLITMLRTTFAD